YNAMCGFFVRVTTDVANRRFSKLQEIDRAIYTWFDQVSAHNEQLSASPHTPVLKQLLVDSDEEHVALIEKTKKKPGVLPFDTSTLDQEEVRQLTALWRSLVSGEGKIQLIGDKSYRKRMLSDLAKILNTTTGRKLLTFLNTESESEQDTGTRNLLTNIYIGQRTGQLPTSVTSQLPTQLQDSGVSRSQPLDDSKAYMQDPVNLNGAGRPQGFYGALTRRGFQTAVLNEKKGVVYQGKKYEFGEGTGAFVHVDTNGGPSSLTGSPGQDSEIISPRFITLAHELGHSANQRAGAGTAGAMGRYDDLFTMSGNATDVAKTDWDDPEEMLNILNVENAVRSESGLVDRTSHKTPEGLKRSRRILSIRQQVTAQFGVADRPDSFRCFDRASQGLWFTATGDAFGRELVRVRNSLENDGHWNTVRGLLQNFLGMNAGNEKSAFAQAAFGEMNRLVGLKGGRDALKPTDQGKFDTVTIDVNNNLGGIVGNTANYLLLLNQIFGVQGAAGGRVDFLGNGSPILNWN
ncbi:MAG TPA: M91 family zinc metallopeptidase, partial [Chloroflexota bacterium]|nr:M91 family zinc metallopeptidase [Chloroflexota bacterium]